ncbi:MAG TPA: hypothetical protein VK624_07260 [Steroidobacteraceae bacterium]|nr:hypothetical protein [Steroidobacteraceae bacterium]
MRIAGTFFACILSVAMISGCKSRMVSCKTDNSKDYAGAKELPPLTAPAGLEVPNTRNSLKVPALNTPERIRGRDEGCLDTPPPFTTPKTTEAPKPK